MKRLYNIGSEPWGCTEWNEMGKMKDSVNDIARDRRPRILFYLRNELTDIIKAEMRDKKR